MDDVGQEGGHFVGDLGEFLVEGAAEEEGRQPQVGEVGPEGRLGAGAHAAQAVGQALGPVAHTGGAVGILNGLGELLLGGEEGQGLPAVDERFDALAFDEIGEALVAGDALFALGAGAQAGRGAFEDEGMPAVGPVQGEVEGQTTAHGVTEEVGARET